MGADDDAPRAGLDTQDVEGVGAGAGAQVEAAALAHREVDDALVVAEDSARAVDDLARLLRFRPQAGDEPGIAARGHEADVLAVGLLGHPEAEAAGGGAGLGLRLRTQGEAQVGELRAGRGEEEVALVLGRLGRAVELGPGGTHHAAGIVTGRQGVGAEVARRREQVAELDRAVALDAGDGGLALEVALGEGVDDLGAEAALVIEHVVGDRKRVRHPAGVVDVAPRAAGVRAGHGRAVVVELERDPDHVVALLREEGRHDRAVDAARHGDRDPSPPGRLLDTERVGHGREYRLRGRELKAGR